MEGADCRLGLLRRMQLWGKGGGGGEGGGRKKSVGARSRATQNHPTMVRLRTRDRILHTQPCTTRFDGSETMRSGEGLLYKPSSS